jgi:hypothetical protein
MDIMKNQMKEVDESLISKLQSHFPSHTLMEVLGVVFLQYWLMPNCEKFFKKHINVVKSHYCSPKRIVPHQT